MRPIVLQRVRLVVSAARKGNDAPPPEDIAPAVAKLCQTGNEAAVKSLLILGELQRKDMLREFDLSTLRSNLDRCHGNLYAKQGFYCQS